MFLELENKKISNGVHVSKKKLENPLKMVDFNMDNLSTTER